MNETAKALQKLIPKEIDVLKRRYNILNNIQLFQPIGRRSLAQRLDISEKIIRSDTEHFKAEGLINVSSLGMEIEPIGIKMLEHLQVLINNLKGLTNIEEIVGDILGCKDIIIVSGDSDKDLEAKINLANAASKVLLDNVGENCIISLTGGSTVNRVINQLKPTNLEKQNILVVPARGSLGNIVEYQANTLVAGLAKKINCQYRLLNIPDNLSQKTLESIKQEPDIKRTISYIIKANVLVYGIGNSSTMAVRRNLDEKTTEFLKEQGAVAEVLGYYFNKFGEVVYTSRSIGITIDEMVALNYPIAVAGGSSKAEAILAVRKFIAGSHVVIDEGAAKRIIDICLDD